MIYGYCALIGPEGWVADKQPEKDKIFNIETAYNKWNLLFSSPILIQSKSHSNDHKDERNTWQTIAPTQHISGVIMNTQSSYCTGTVKIYFQLA